MNKRYLSTIWLGLVLLLLLSGCGGSKIPTGTFKSDSSGYKIEISEDGNFALNYGDGIMRATFTAQGNELTWQTYEYCERVSMHNNATYIFTYDNNTLTFELKGEEKCPVREAMLTTPSWLRQE